MSKINNNIIVPILLTIIIGVILFINYFPHYFALIHTPENYSYSGQASWFDPWDINNYFATIKISQNERKLLLSNINTTEEIKPALIYPLYTTVAVLFPNINHIVLYHFLAVLCGILLAYAIFVFCRVFLKNSFYSLYGLLIIAFGGGFGFLFSAYGMSADLSIPGVTFFSNFQKPHEAAAAMLYISSLVFFYLSVDQKRKLYLLISIISFLLLIPIYPYRLLSFFIIAGIFGLYFYLKKLEKYPFAFLGIFSAFIFPPTFLYVFHFLNSGFSVLTRYQPQPVSLLSIISGYGFFILFFIYQLFFLKNKSSAQVFLNIWVIVSLVLAIVPFGMGRLFFSGLLFPMSLLFVLFLKKNSSQDRIITFFIMMAVLIFTIPVSLYTFHRRIAEVTNNNIWFYTPKSYKTSFDFIENSKEDGVLALPPLSNYIPARTGKHVYFGIKDQSPNYDVKLSRAEDFYLGKLTESEAKKFLQNNNINLVVATIGDKNTENFPYQFLKVVYKNKEVEVFKPF